MTKRSDLQSLLYCVLDGYMGTLPWINNKNKYNIDQIKRIKQILTNKNKIKKWINNNEVPLIFYEIWEYIMNLNYLEKPNYDKLFIYLHNYINKMNKNKIQFHHYCNEILNEMKCKCKQEYNQKCKICQ